MFPSRYCAIYSSIVIMKVFISTPKFSNLTCMNSVDDSLI